MYHLGPFVHNKKLSEGLPLPHVYIIDLHCSIVESEGLPLPHVYIIDLHCIIVESRKSIQLNLTNLLLHLGEFSASRYVVISFGLNTCFHLIAFHYYV